MADRVDAAMHAVQRTAAQAVLDGAAPEARVDELSPGDDAVLPSGMTRDDGVRVGLGAFCMHHMHKAPRLRSSPPNGALFRGPGRFLHAPHA